MNEEKLNQRLKAYYNHKKLPEASVEKLKKIMEQVSARQDNENIGLKDRWSGFFNRLIFDSTPRWVTVFSSLLVVCLVTWQVTFQGNVSTNLTESAVLKEITMNHKKDLVPEFKGTSIPALAALMPKLNFSPMIPDMVAAMALKFIGARYCSIQGNLAVQLKFETPSGNVCTLYQALSTERLLKIHDIHTISEDVNVRLWHEKGLFMAVAGITE